MKMVKKILLGLVATAAVIGFAGCKASVEDEYNMLKVSGDKCSIDHENKTTNQYNRSWETLKQDHVDGICKITAEITDKTTANGSGVFGYIFNLKQNEDKSYNFTLAGVRFKPNGHIEGYVSDYKNVGAKYMKEGNDFCDINGKKAGTAGSLATCTEKLGTQDSPIVDLVTKSYTTGSKVSIWIDVVAYDGISTGRSLATGSTAAEKGRNKYYVKFYDEDPVRTKNGDNLTYNTVAPKATSTAIELNNKLPDGVANFSPTKGQSKLGFYANVYASSKLKGNWEIPTASLYHEAEEIDE